MDELLMDEHGALPENSAVSQITRIELLSHRAMSKDEESRILAILKSVTVIPLDERIEAEAIVLRRRARLKLPDAIIGATAKVAGLKL